MFSCFSRRFNQVGIFFLIASNSSVSLIVHWWTERCFTQCIVKSHAYPLVYFFQPRATLCNWARRQIFLFECTNCFDCPLLNIEPVLFSHIVSRKDFSKTFLVLVWILIERPYKWRHQPQVDLTVFYSRNLRTLHCLWSSEYQTQLDDLWSGMKVNIPFCLLENSRFGKK